MPSTAKHAQQNGVQIRFAKIRGGGSYSAVVRSAIIDTLLIPFPAKSWTTLCAIKPLLLLVVKVVRVVEEEVCGQLLVLVAGKVCLDD